MSILIIHNLPDFNGLPVMNKHPRMTSMPAGGGGPTAAPRAGCPGSRQIPPRRGAHVGRSRSPQDHPCDPPLMHPPLRRYPAKAATSVNLDTERIGFGLGAGGRAQCPRRGRRSYTGSECSMRGGPGTKIEEPHPPKLHAELGKVVLPGYGEPCHSSAVWCLFGHRRTSVIHVPILPRFRGPQTF